MIRKIGGLLYRTAGIILVWASFVLMQGCHRENRGGAAAVPVADDLLLPIVGIGPHNETPSTIADLRRILKNVKPGSFNRENSEIALCMHDLYNDWSQAIVRGITATLDLYGLQLSVVTDGEFNINKQLKDIDNVISLKPRVMIVLPLDVDAVVPVLRKAVETGIQLAFIDAVPTGFTAKKEYIAWAVGDAYVMGKGSAELLCDYLGNKGSIALLHWKNKMFTVDKRSEAALDVVGGRPGITLVEQLYFKDFSEINGLVSSLLERHPDLGGLWAVWDTPAFEAIGAIKAKSARTVVTASDMSADVARAIAKNDVMIGTTVDHPYDQGVIEALIAVAILAQVEIPPYFVVPAEKVTKENLGAAWKRMYHAPLPENFEDLPKGD